MNNSKLKPWLPRLVPVLVIIFWLCFFLAYQWRDLIDDVNYRKVLENKIQNYNGLWFRPLHDWLLYLQGYFFEPSPVKAILLSMLMHMGVGVIAWRLLIPRLPKESRIYAIIGLVSFLVHPVALQTSVHISQRGEILGAVFVLLALTVYLKAREIKAPSHWYFVGLSACALMALLSKENFALVSLILLIALSVQARSLIGAALTLIVAAAMAFVVNANGFSNSTVQNDSNYKRSREFRQAVQEGREVTKDNSIILPLRDRTENIQIQTALIPLGLQVVLAPFALAKDYGHFPYGKRSYALNLMWLWVGVFIVFALLVLFVYYRRQFILSDWFLICSPFLLYSVYLVFPVYDPLVLYRLYAVVLLLFTISLPMVLKFMPQVNRAVFGMLAVLCIFGGATRAYEMADPVREARLELARTPENFRAHISYVHARLEAGVRPIDCKSELDPALKFAPSQSWIFMEIAYCLRMQGAGDEAKAYAEKALQHETTPENVQVAIQFLMGPGGMNVPAHQIHPFNLKYLLKNSSATPPTETGGKSP